MINQDAMMGLRALRRARDLTRRHRKAMRLPSVIMDDLDTLYRSVYHWRDSGGSHAKIYECGDFDAASEMARAVSQCFRWNAVQGSSQHVGEGKLRVSFEGPHHSRAIYDEIDSIHTDVCGLNFTREESR